MAVSSNFQSIKFMVIIFMQNHFWWVLTVYKAKKTYAPYMWHWIYDVLNSRYLNKTPYIEHGVKKLIYIRNLA